MQREIWENWNNILSEYSYLYLVGSISATSLEPTLGTFLCFVLGVIFHLQTYSKAEKIFGRRRKLRKYKKYKGLNRLKLEEIKKLEEIEKSLGKNPLDCNSQIYFISMIVSTSLLLYN